MSRGKVGILASLTLLGLSFMLLGTSPAAAPPSMAVSEPAGSADDLDPAAPENASAVVDNEAPSVTISFDRSPDDGARQVPFGTNFATGGFVSGSAASVSIVNDVAGYRIDCEGSDGSSATFDTADDAFEATDSGGLSYFDDGVNNGVTYTCGIVAYDAAGNESDPITLTADVETLGEPPAPPASLTVLAVGLDNISVQFEASPNDVPGHDNPVTFYRISIDGTEFSQVDAATQSFYETSVSVDAEGDYIIAVTAVTVVEGIEFESGAVSAVAIARVLPPGVPSSLQLDLTYDTSTAQFNLNILFAGVDETGKNLSYEVNFSNTTETLIIPAEGSSVYEAQATFAEEGDVTVSVATRDNDTDLLSAAITATVTATVPETVAAQLTLPTDVDYDNLDSGQQDVVLTSVADQIAAAAGIPVSRVLIVNIISGSLVVDFEIIPSAGEPSEEEPSVQEAFASLESEIEADPQTFTEELTADIAAEDPTLAQELDLGEPVVAEVVQSSQSLGSTFKDEEIRARVTGINQLGEADEITIEVEGDGFSVSETSLTLDAGAEGSFDIVFSASENGDYEGIVTISTNDPANPGEIVTVSATVIPDPPDIELSADAIEFETTLVGDSSDETLTISNYGEADLNVIFNVLGDEGFSAVDDETEITVLGGASVDVIVTFTPVEGGDFVAFLVVESDDPDAEQAILIVTLSGDALVPVAGIALSDDTIDFGTLLVGDSSDETLTIENTGISDLEVELVLEGDMVFSVTGETMFTVSGGESADVEMVAEPDADGDFEGTLVVNSNSPENPSLEVALSVTGVEPQPEIDVSSLAVIFGTVGLGHVPSITVNIGNVGDADLTGDITISGDDVFTLSPGGPFTVMAGGESLAVEVTFEPDAEADNQATISITSNDADEPEIMIPVVGTGVSRIEACVSAAGEILRTDFDGDGTVGYAEFFALVDHFNSALGQPGYDGAFDLVSDGVINYPDFFAYLDDFGKTCTIKTLPALRITNATVAPGGSVTVTVEVDNGEGIGALGFDLVFDPSLFTLDDADKTGLGDSDSFDLTSVDEGSDRVTGSFLSSAGLPADESSGSLLEVMLTVDANAFPGIIVGLQLEVTELTDANGIPIPPAVFSGRVTIQ